MILHVDGDSFFASCEISLRPDLKGRPVVTGEERGIASAMSREAKKRGVTRGMPIGKVRELVPDVVIVSSDYELYSIFCHRMYSIVSRYTEVEPYSIDECFADITGVAFSLGISDYELGRKIKGELETELGMTFSVGIAPTKTLAKVASSHNKPSGLTVIERDKVFDFLKDVPIGDVWGIGWRSAPRMRMLGFLTAEDFARAPEEFIAERFSKPYYELWYELRGVPIRSVHSEYDDQKSIMKTRTFSPGSNDKKYVYSQLVKNIEGATMRARELGLYANNISFFLKTSEFKYYGRNFNLVKSTNTPYDIIEAIGPVFNLIFKQGIKYRATGIVLHGLVSVLQANLFSKYKDIKIFDSIDHINSKYGRTVIHLAASSLARHRENGRDRAPTHQNLLYKENNRRPLYIPFMGTAI